MSQNPVHFFWCTPGTCDPTQSRIGSMSLDKCANATIIPSVTHLPHLQMASNSIPHTSFHLCKIDSWDYSSPACVVVYSYQPTPTAIGLGYDEPWSFPFISMDLKFGPLLSHYNHEWAWDLAVEVKPMYLLARNPDLILTINSVN